MAQIKKTTNVTDKKTLSIPKQQNILLKEIQSFEGKVAERVTDFAGSMPFAYYHVGWFSFWILANHGIIPGVPIFDPFPYGLLTMIVSLEAIFLSTFIMVAQNRQELVDEFRELEEEQEELEEDKEQEELEEEVEDIQNDLDQIKNAIISLQQKIVTHKGQNGN